MLAVLPPLSILENCNVGDLYFHHQHHIGIHFTLNSLTVSSSIRMFFAYNFIQNHVYVSLTLNLRTFLSK